jgi:hypothetical protein
MNKFLIIAAVALLSLSQSGLAQDQNTQKVKPGTDATGAMSDQVPTMKGGCQDNAKVDTKAPQTEATEAVGQKVPDMKEAAKDCPDTGQKNVKKN